MGVFRGSWCWALLVGLMGVVGTGCGDDEVTAAEFCERAQSSVSGLVDKARPCLSDVDEQALEEELQATLPPEESCEAHVEEKCAQEDRKAAVELADCLDEVATCTADTALVFAAAVDDCLEKGKADVAEACLPL